MWRTSEDAKLDFAWFLYFGENEKKIVRVVEYLDSPPVKEYYGWQDSGDIGCEAGRQDEVE